MNEFGDELTTKNITGGDIELTCKLNVGEHVDNSYPPTFMWATKDDQLVRNQNFYSLKESLEKNNVLHKCKLYETGPHGLSLANRGVYQKEGLSAELRPVRDWASDASDFIFDILDNR